MYNAIQTVKIMIHLLFNCHWFFISMFVCQFVGLDSASVFFFQFLVPIRVTVNVVGNGLCCWLSKYAMKMDWELLGHSPIVGKSQFSMKQNNVKNHPNTSQFYGPYREHTLEHILTYFYVLICFHSSCFCGSHKNYTAICFVSFSKFSMIVSMGIQNHKQNPF